MPLKKAGSNWVDGDRFFNRDAELENLAERASVGTHTLITAPRRMGKTSLVREFLRRAGLSAQINIFEPLALRPWTESVALGCLSSLAANYGVDLPESVKREICRRLRCLVPHHVQQFFDHLHECLRRTGRNVATLSDVDHVYRNELLSVRGQMNNDHYQSRLRLVLNDSEYPAALELLTEASIADGLLSDESISLYRERYGTEAGPGSSFLNLEEILYLLEHDGYLVRNEDGYSFLSGFLQDWWQARNGRNFVPIAERIS